MNRADQDLELEQEMLLCNMVEAERTVGRDERQMFTYFNHHTREGLIHPGLRDDQRNVQLMDLDELEEKGFIRMDYGQAGNKHYWVSPEGRRYYQQLHGRDEQRSSVVETHAKQFIRSELFKRRHSASLQKWVAANELLWSDEADRQASTIGHLCRECIQTFVDELACQLPVDGCPEGKNLTKKRLEFILKQSWRGVPSSVLKLLEAMHAHFCCVANLIERQEHDATREKEELRWEDSRRVVFHTLLIIYEIDRTLQGFETR